ncbi:MAG: 1-deoxy-D-xylulose-5-phosphate reductoisomerase [Christensenellaceae bacterium]|nr:1-deoxy-D-xylulose-5-phosphate reductoisomerase [Christensenellaceae bacterium]
MRKIAILGTTGSIGSQALSIVDAYPDKFSISALSAHSNAVELFNLVRKYRPSAAALTSGEVQIPEDLSFCNWYFGETALEKITRDVPCDDVLVSVVGMSALKAVINAIDTGKRVLLANKETIVAGGNIIMPKCDLFSENANLIPIDSEHSAIHQCLLGAKDNAFNSLILTASGGPFRTWSIKEMQNVRPEDALKHPTWDMGKKITIDSASMFNKALEIIEAKWLFSAEPSQIDVLVHPESIVHSMVEYKDFAVMAQLGVPDMRTSIMYAMFYPVRMGAVSERLNLADIHTLHFEKPDTECFPSIALAYDALRLGGSAPCVLNAANEIAVEAFLNGKIGFLNIADTVKYVLSKELPKAKNADEIIYADNWARCRASEYIDSIN